MTLLCNGDTSCMLSFNIGRCTVVLSVNNWCKPVRPRYTHLLTGGNFAWSEKCGHTTDAEANLSNSKKLFMELGCKKMGASALEMPWWQVVHRMAGQLYNNKSLQSKVKYGEDSTLITTVSSTINLQTPVTSQGTTFPIPSTVHKCFLYSWPLKDICSDNEDII